jgi:hypothetical protein
MHIKEFKRDVNPGTLRHHWPKSRLKCAI